MWRRYGTVTGISWGNCICKWNNGICTFKFSAWDRLLFGGGVCGRKEWDIDGGEIQDLLVGIRRDVD